MAEQGDCLWLLATGSEDLGLDLESGPESQRQVRFGVKGAMLELLTGQGFGLAGVGCGLVELVGGK